MHYLIIFIILAFSIIVHEVAHGWMADRLGDPTARLSGRLTLNPIPHIDPIGTILVPLLMYLSPLHLVFGWAKPVPFDPYNLKDPKRDSALISLAGPIANMTIATILAIIYRFVPNQTASGLISQTIGLNVILAVFNLFPVSPLDGEKILVGLLPHRQARVFDAFMSRFGMILLFFLIFPIFGGISLISPILFPVTNFVLNLLIPGFGTI